MKLGYTWKDINDPYALTSPQLGHAAEQTIGADTLYPTKRKAIKGAEEYAAEGGFDIDPGTVDGATGAASGFSFAAMAHYRTG